MSNSNKTLNKARNAKNDEFYTQYKDIENELNHYSSFFKDKVIYCNCDNPKYSQFWKYFKDNFKSLNLKKLISTYYRQNNKSICTIYNGITELKIQLSGDGNFFSEECLKYLQECDIIVTNPPFSLVKEYIPFISKLNVDYILIIPKNAIKYTKIFPLFKEEKIRCGYNHSNGTMVFNTKDGLKSAPAYWITTLSVNKNNVVIPSKEFNPLDYPKYDNYDAIEVSNLKNIPKDYYEPMGVPITYLNHHNEKLFKILGFTARTDYYNLKTKKYTKNDYENYNDMNVCPCIKLENGKYIQKYARIIIKRK